MDRILRLPARGQPPHESLSSQPSHGHGKLGGKSAAEDRTVQAFPDLSARNAIISNTCRGVITLGDQSFIVQAVPDHDCGVAAGQHVVYTLSCATEDAYVLEACKAMRGHHSESCPRRALQQGELVVDTSRAPGQRVPRRARGCR